MPTGQGADRALWLWAGRVLAAVLVAIALSLAESVTRAAAAAAAVTEFRIPDGGGVAWITSGPDGALWFIDQGAVQDPNSSYGLLYSKIGRITTSGHVTEFALPNPYSQPTAIAAGPDGALWFTEQGQPPSGIPQIGRITTTGTVTEFPAPGNPSDGIAAGADGALWFTERDAGRIGRITTAGQVTDFPIPNSGGGFPLAIAAGPDGALWFVDEETGPSYIGRITTAGDVKLFPVRPASALGSIAAGPDGAVWFTNAGPAFTLGGETLGRITSAGVLTSIPAPEGVAASGGGLVTGPDGALWFTSNGIGRLMPGVAGGNGGTHPQCVVPRIVGKKLAAAKKALKAAHCSLGKLKRARTRKPKRGRVISQSAHAGKRLAAGARVDVVVGR